MFYHLEACLFYNSRRKGDKYIWDKTWEELRGGEGGEIIIRIYYMRKNIFNKRKIKIKRNWTDNIIDLFFYCLIY